MNKITIYWAAPLFTQAERIWNRLCAENLRKRGYDVILPQDEAKKFIKAGRIDFQKIAENCLFQATSPDTDVMVAVLDGADSDSGTSLEVGLRIKSGGWVVGIRTDCRGSEDKGLNAMFRLADEIIYFPSFNESYEELCDKIDEAIKGIIDIETKIGKRKAD